MIESVRQIIKESLEDYKTRARAEWVLMWPGQIVICGCQFYWTQAVSEALEKKKIEEYHKVQLSELDDLRTLVRGNLTPKSRQTLSALITIEVHARDVVINLIEEKVRHEMVYKHPQSNICIFLMACNFGVYHKIFYLYINIFNYIKLFLIT